MNKLLLFSFLSLLCFQGLAQLNITYTDFDGQGLVIEKGTIHAFDINGNGSTDFNIKSSETRINLLPIIFVGCFASDGSYSNNTTKRISQFEEGEFIAINGSNMYDYIDDQPASPYTVNEGFAEFWSDLEEVYIGFAVFDLTGATSNGWMKVAVDKSNQSFIVKEMAYTDFVAINNGGIHAGDKGVASSIGNLDGILNNINISPNPARGTVQIAFDFESKDALNVNIVNGMGQTLYTTDAIQQSTNTLQVETADWAPGTYFVQFRTAEGISTKRFTVL